MHEGAITQALVEQVLPLIPPGATPVRCTIEIGTLEHLDAIVMTTMWQAMTRDTALTGTALDIRCTNLRVRCRACDTEHTPEDPSILVCPACCAVEPEVLAGSGIVLKAIEVDQPQ